MTERLRVCEGLCVCVRGLRVRRADLEGTCAERVEGPATEGLRLLLWEAIARTAGTWSRLHHCGQPTCGLVVSPQTSCPDPCQAHSPSPPPPCPPAKHARPLCTRPSRSSGASSPRVPTDWICRDTELVSSFVHLRAPGLTVAGTPTQSVFLVPKWPILGPIVSPKVTRRSPDPQHLRMRPVGDGVLQDGIS